MLVNPDVVIGAVVGALVRYLLDKTAQSEKVRAINQRIKHQKSRAKDWLSKRFRNDKA